MSFFLGLDSVARSNIQGTNLAEEHAIVLAVRASDVRVFAQLFRGYYHDLHRYARAMTHSAEIAEEVVDDVFAALWERRAEWAPASTIRAYLYRAVRNRALNAIIAAKSATRVETLAALEVNPIAMSQEPAAPDQAFASNETEMAVRAAVDTLSQEARMVVALRWQAELSWAEVSEVTGLSIDAARMKHTRALRLLKERLMGLLS